MSHLDLLLCPGSGVHIAISLSVCVSVCVSVCLRAYLWNRWTDFHKIFVQIRCGRDSVLWQRCDTLCTCSVMDDITFGCSGSCDDHCDTGVESDVSECLVGFVCAKLVNCDAHTFCDFLSKCPKYEYMNV